MSDVTQILNSISSGDPQGSDQLLPLVYKELKRMAAAQMRREASGHTLQPTALVHEAYLRLVGGEAVNWDSRRHFYAAAAEAMRRILVDQARRKLREKHGGQLKRIPLEDEHHAEDRGPNELLFVDEALQGLFAADEQAAQLVKLRYFGGYSFEDAAKVLGISERTAYRDWAFAKAWLQRQLRRSDGSE